MADDRCDLLCLDLDQSSWDTCFVVDDQRIVLGRLGRRAIRDRQNVLAEEAMKIGRASCRERV